MVGEEFKRQIYNETDPSSCFRLPTCVAEHNLTIEHVKIPLMTKMTQSLGEVMVTAAEQWELSGNELGICFVFKLDWYVFVTQNKATLICWTVN